MMPLWALRPCFLVNHLLHFTVEVFPGLGGLGVARSVGPVGVRHDHQLALGVDEDALAEDAAGRIAAVVIGPPLVAIAAPGAANVGALRRALFGGR